VLAPVSPAGCARAFHLLTWLCVKPALLA
jgi:hypothetical protein